MAQQRLIELFNRFRSKTCTPAEKQELAILCLLPENKEAVETLLAETWENINVTQLMPAEKANHILQLILNDAEEQTTPDTAVISLPTTDHRQQFNWKRIAVAASILLAVTFGVYVIGTKEKSQPTHDSPLTTHDISAPDKNRAQIKLADGTIVYLDSATNGQLATQSNVTVTKTADGKIVYTTPSAVATPTAVSYNTLTNPRGSIVMNMTLSDGSKVWLNAGSSITYPVAFVGSERKISMTGEGYFEVAKDAKKKFIVEANGTTTEVLGTHFNINAYDDEEETKITLLEGSVNVSSRLSASAVKIKPGQQAVFNPANPSIKQIRVQTNVDLDQTMSWRNGYFNFNQQTISSIMRELGRWYNTEIIFSGPTPDDKFSAIIKRSNNISQVLKMLEKTNRVHFKIEDNKITVTR